MNKYQADLSCHNPVMTLRNDAAAAIVTEDDETSYNLFNKWIRDLASDLHARGVREEHRVLVVGNDMDISSSIAWTWAVMYLGASAANADDSVSQENIQLKANAGNVNFIVWCVDQIIECVNEHPSKVHPEERFILYSSGTTKKKDNIYGVEPQFFTYHDNWEGGIAHIDCLKLAYKYLGEVPIRQIACHPWEVAYAPHNVVNTLLTGGTYYWVEDESDMVDVQWEYKTNLMSNYPLSYDPICSVWHQDTPAIEYVEVAGGICTPQLIERLRKTLKPRIISNSFISSKSGTILNRTIDASDDPEQCAWMKHPDLDDNLKLRLDDSNALWYKRNGPWMTDGDIFEQEGDYYRVVGKASEEFIQTEYGKINTWEIEQHANQLTRMVWGCGEHTYCFAMPHMACGVRHGLVYSGPLRIERMVERMNELPDYKRPHTIYQVKPEFWSLNIKVSRDRMSDRLYENQEYIEKTAKCDAVPE